MEVSRREFLRYASGAGAGTALGGIVGLGLTLAPARAKAQRLRIKDSRTVPSICPRAFICSVMSAEAGAAVTAQVSAAAMRRLELMERSRRTPGALGDIQ